MIYAYSLKKVTGTTTGYDGSDSGYALRLSKRPFTAGEAPARGDKGGKEASEEGPRDPSPRRVGSGARVAIAASVDNIWKNNVR